MKLPLTLSLYITRQFLFYLTLVISTITLLILVVDMLELLRRSANKEVPFWVVMQMALLKYPMLMQKFLPFIMLIAGMLTYTSLSRHQELTICRASGVSVWQFLFPSVITAFLFGTFIVSVFNPLASAMAMKYETVESKYFLGKSSLFAVSESGLWLKQKNFNPVSEKVRPGETIIYAIDAAEEGNAFKLLNTMFLVFDESGELEKRLDAQTASLLDSYWRLNNVMISTVSGKRNYYDEYFLETEFTSEDIQNSFSPPETISFWELPAFIETITKSGFSALPHKLHWHTILASPFFYAAMVIVAAIFSLRQVRAGKTGLFVALTVVVGFFVYFMTNVVASFGLSGTLPVVIAAWMPIMLSILAGVSILLHIEDG